MRISVARCREWPILTIVLVPPLLLPFCLHVLSSPRAEPDTAVLTAIARGFLHSAEAAARSGGQGGLSAVRLDAKSDLYVSYCSATKSTLEDLLPPRGSRAAVVACPPPQHTQITHIPTNAISSLSLPSLLLPPFPPFRMPPPHPTLTSTYSYLPVSLPCSLPHFRAGPPARQGHQVVRQGLPGATGVALQAALRPLRPQRKQQWRSSGEALRGCPAGGRAR